MRGRLKIAAAVFVVLVVAAQFVGPDRTNPSTDPGLAIGAQPGTPGDLATVLDRSCGDCHSNHTVWRSYTNVAPLSWAMAYAVTEGRSAVNFSEWGAYPQAHQQALLAASCRDVSENRMPSAYTLVRPETRLSADDVEIICAAARQGTVGAVPGTHAR